MRVLISTCLFAAASCANGQQCGWNQRALNEGPVNPFGGCLVFDSKQDVSVLLCGLQNIDARQTWEWNGVNWTLRSEQGPPNASTATMAYDALRGVTLLYGGFGQEAQTWRWNDQSWSMLTPAHTPVAFARAKMVFDSSRGVAVLFGGSFDGDDGPVYVGDTWEWDGADWHQAAKTGPSPRVYHSMAYDSGRRVTVIYGGLGNGQTFSDTWEWDGAAWTQRGVNGPMGERFRGAMVYDSGLHACVYFGGNQSGNGVQNDTWAWDGESWTRLDTPNAPEPRSDHAMAYDSQRGAIVLFGGRDGNGEILNDTWELTCSPPCYPDLDGNGVLDLFDFLAFVNAFNAGDTGPADCDHNQSLDLFDFLCYTNAFNKGC